MCKAQWDVLQPSQIYLETVSSTVTVVSENGFGSGFYVLPNVIVTNYHVVEGAKDVYCVPANEDYKLRVSGYMGIDKDADLILLKVEGAAEEPLPMAQGRINTGQVVYAIGTPEGMSGTISNGIVSAVRDAGGVKLLQITAPVSHGSSGGPVLNRMGQVVGVSTLMHSEGQNLNFAVDYHHISALMRNMYQRPVSLASLNERRPAERRQSGGSSSSGNRQPENNTSSGRFRRDYNYIAVYDPQDKEWSDWQEGTNTVVFNVNDNGDIKIYYASGEYEVFRKISEVYEDSADDGEEYQIVAILDEDGEEMALQLFNNGNMKLIYPDGTAFFLTNNGQ
jgi:hypothetical protein